MLKQIKSGIYQLLHPKTAFFLTSIGKDGKPNVMACAWAMPVSKTKLPYPSVQEE